MKKLTHSCLKVRFVPLETYFQMTLVELRFSGHDTTSAAMTWTIQEIGNNQEVLKKCLAEIDEVFGDSDRPASMDDLNRLEVK